MDIDDSILECARMLQHERASGCGRMEARECDEDPEEEHGTTEAGERVLCVLHSSFIDFILADQ